MKQKLSKTKKLLIGFLTPVIALVLAFFVLCVITMCTYSPAYLKRVLTHWDSKVDDYKIFPSRVIEKSQTPYRYEKDINQGIDEISLPSFKRGKTLGEFLDKTDTTTFLVVKNDKIIYEKYANGYNENSVNTSFSMAKSVVSLLVGKAVEKGFIKSVTQPISDYVTEFKGQKIGETTIEDLLMMRSDIVYEEGFLWFGDDSLTYFHPDLRSLALSHTDLTNYGGKFHYNNYHPLLLGIILERCTGVSVSEFFEKEFWQPIGAEFDATWSLDSVDGFEKMESGINFRTVDFLKIGSMVLHGGVFNGTEIINGEWLKLSTLCEFPINENDYKNSFLDGKNIGYKYMWYTTPSNKAGYDVIAWGKSDQILYISPAEQTVVLRTGKTDGGVSNWAETIKSIIAEVDNLQD